MVLLLSSQIQVALSSAIIITFTFLLFLAGYVAQQKTVSSLQNTIRPHAPSPRHKPLAADIPKADPIHRLSRPFGRLRDRMKWQTQLAKAEEAFSWDRLAFAQVVRDHSELCNALIIFSDLHKLRSQAPRLLLFPQHWIQDTTGARLDPIMETTRRLIRKAARRYRVILAPMEPSKGLHEDNPGAYSISTLFSLDHYKRILTFPPPGLVLDSVSLDSILAFSETDAVAAYPLLNSTGAPAILIAPSKKNEQTFRHQALTSLHSDALLPYAEDESLFTTTHRLRTIEPASFNATDFLDTTAFIHFEDPDLPGPEFDIPYSSVVKMRPGGEDQGFLWEKMYSMFKDRRYGVCGLDLEVWPPIPKVKAKDASEARKHEGKMDL